MEKLISVIIPAYNAENFIGECLEKLLGQNYDNFEVIVVNDGSKDNTLEIAQSYADKDDRVKILNQENGGTAVARLNGVSIATGKYIMFLDSDDFYVDGGLKRVGELIQKYNTDLIKFRFQTYPALKPLKPVLGEEEIVLKKDEFAEKLYPIYLTHYYLNGVTTLAIKRSLLNAKNIENYRGMRYGEDLKLSMALLDKIENIAIVPDIIYNYFANDASITRTRNAQRLLGSVKSFAKVYTEQIEYLKKWKIDTKDNMKKLYLKVMREMADFYDKMINGEDRDFIENSHNEIKEAIYSPLTLTAIENLSIDDLDENYPTYDVMVKIYKKEI